MACHFHPKAKRGGKPAFSPFDVVRSSAQASLGQETQGGEPIALIVDTVDADKLLAAPQFNLLLGTCDTDLVGVVRSDSLAIRIQEVQQLNAVMAS